MEIINYYAILGLKYEYTPLKLFWNYVLLSGKALKSKSTDNFIKIRQGFEILRDEKATDSYNRIFKKHVLKQTLNYPHAKEQQMLLDFLEKEKQGKKDAENFINKKGTFRKLIIKLVFEIIIADLTQFIYFGSTGLLFIVVGIWCIIKYPNELNISGGSLLVLLGFFFLRRNIKNYITG